MNIIRPNTCATCSWKHREPDKRLVCRRNAPIGHPIIAYVQQVQGVPAKQPMTVLVPNVQGTMSIFPNVEPDWWCGEHTVVSTRMEAGETNDHHVRTMVAK